MAQTCVFTKCPVIGFEGVNARREALAGGFCYTVEHNGDARALVGFVVHAVICNLVNRRLRGNGLGADKKTSELFIQKLAAYLSITGNKGRFEETAGCLLAESGIIDIDGIITFRLKEIADDISAFFDLLYYEYNVRKQYDDFIALLKDYVRLEGAGEEAVHIVFRGKGFVLYNAKKANITYSALKSYNHDSDFSDGNLNDFLISSLLNYLPKKIILHSQNSFKDNSSARIADTITAIFTERVVRCEGGCELCGYETPLTLPGFSGYPNL